MALPSWPFYGVGGVVVLAGFVFLHRWLQGLMGRRDHPHGPVLAAAFVAFLVGSGTLILAVGIDNEQVRIENTRIFTYDVTIEATGAGPFRLVLPAPEDDRLRDAFNQTNGSATMRYVRSGPEPFVDIVTDGNVSFAVRVVVYGPVLSTNLTRLDRAQPVATNASLDFADEGIAASSAVVRIDIRFEEFCEIRHLSLDAVVSEGLSDYPVVDDVDVC